MCKYRDIQEVRNIFMMADARLEDIEQAGNNAIATMYGCKRSSDLISNAHLI